MCTPIPHLPLSQPETRGIPVPVLREESHACQCHGHRGTCPRRYHAVAGLVLGVMLILHFSITLLGLWPTTYQRVLAAIHRHQAVLIVAEVFFVFVPLAVHAGYGLRFLWREGITLPASKHHYGSARRFFWQRVTAICLGIFIVFHVATMHRWGFHLAYEATHWQGLQRYAEGGLFSPDRAYASTKAGVRTFWNQQERNNPGNLLVLGLYLLAIAAAVYHLANGVSTSAMVYDWTVTAETERRLGRFCWMGGFVLCGIGVTVWLAFT